ncbi:hypothetical protein ACXZ1M_00570 [Duganella sp. PWIR1]
MENLPFRIVEVFEITGRGAAVVFHEVIELKSGTPTPVKIVTPDGETFEAVGFVVLFLRRQLPVVKKSVLLLQDIQKDKVPVGSQLCFL